LQATREELRVTEEKLRAQNEELAAARQQVEAERQRYRDLFEFAPDAYLVTDAAGVILEANRAAAGLLNVNQVTLEHKRLAVFLASGQRAAFSGNLARLAEGQPRYAWETLLVPRGQTPRDVSVTVAAISPPAPGGAALRWLLRDVTARKQADRLAAIGEMVAGLAHESRNALQRSEGCLERLIWRLQNQPEALDLVGRMQQAHADLRRLFEDVRTYAGPILLELTPCNLLDAWRTAWEHLAERRAGRDAELRETTDLEPECDADLFRLQQVFDNVFDNALAACADPVRINVRCTATTLAGRAAWRVSVHDNGPGLNAEQRAKIFEPFYTTKPKGTGLGMAIAKRIIEAHGGQLQVGQGQRPGTEIVIALPSRIP
jgi:PAS domain S-box-containing protein